MTMFRIRGRLSDTFLNDSVSDALALKEEIEPYLAVSQDSGDADPECWTVSTSLQGKGGEQYETQPIGEPRAGFALDRVNRSVAPLFPATGTWPRQNAIRITRAIHKLLSAGHGEVFLHGGLVVIDGLGVLLCGPSRSGKTTLAAAASLGGAAFVANDDVSISLRGGNQLEGHGWPRSISMRMDSWKALSESWADDLHKLTHPANVSLRDLRVSGLEPHGTALLYPKEFANTFKSTLMPAARVDVILFPSFYDDRHGPSLKPVSRTEAMDRLQACRRLDVVTYENFLTTCFPLRNENIALRALSYASTLPCFAMTHAMQSIDASLACITELVKKLKRQGHRDLV